MRDPKSMTLDELLNHHDRNVRGAAYELMREVSMTQLEDVQREIVVAIERTRTVVRLPS